jgi:hypothetical protein
MFQNQVIIGSLFLAAGLAFSASSAHADNLNTSGTICRSAAGSQVEDISASAFGVRNTNVAMRSVVCSVPRSPLANFGPVVIPSYFIDGRNNPGTCTQCTLSMYRYTGVLSAMATVTGCATPIAPVDWDLAVPLPPVATGTDTYDYASVTCALPGSSNGVLYGITVIQP